MMFILKLQKIFLADATVNLNLAMLAN